MTDLLDRIGRGRLIGVGIGLAVVLGLVARGQKAELVIGVITGLGYSLVALGLVLIYKSSGVFNFAQAEFGTVAVFVMYLCRVNDMPYVPAMLLGLLAAVVMGYVVERVVVRPLFDAPRVTLLVATAGVALLSIGITF